MRSISLFILFSGLSWSCNNTIPREYDYTPVLLHVDKFKQHDSIGFNLATAIPKLLYGKLLSGDIAIWNSPNKQLHIDKDALLALEKTALVPFVESQNFFIHEAWKLFKRRFDFGILGFSFTGQRKDGSKINYGYVDAVDVITLMKEKVIPCNANGSGTLTYWEALESMSFAFNIVQFGDDDFKQNPMKSFQLKAQIMDGSQIVTHFYQIPLVKEIEYKIVNPNIIKKSENINVFKAFTEFINSNKQVILNAGGSRYLTHLSPGNWKIDEIIITEIWKKKDNLPYQELRSVQIFIEQEAVILHRDQLQNLNLKVNLQGLEEYLSEKNFAFVLQRINQQEIAAFESQIYYDALLTKEWNKLKL